MATTIAINGFGRIGRLFFRQTMERSDLEVVAINDLGDAETLAYLLKYDTAYGKLTEEVSVEGDTLKVGDRSVKVLQEKDPGQLPWGDLGVDVVVEATGVFDSYSKAQPHLEAGAKRVVITAPSDEEDGESGQTVLMGVNEEKLKTCKISSNGSCTTNASSPVVQVLSQNPGVEKAILNTTHGYTASQNLVDGPPHSSHIRRARAAAQNITPSSTGAATTVTRAVRGLDNKFDGIALRVPVIAGSAVDITFVASRETSSEEINGILEDASKDPVWEGVLGVTREPLVSSDILGESYGALVDLAFTRVVDGNLVKVLSWYDNEWGYVSTLIRHVERASAHLE